MSFNVLLANPDTYLRRKNVPTANRLPNAFRSEVSLRPMVLLGKKKKKMNGFLCTCPYIVSNV